MKNKLWILTNILILMFFLKVVSYSIGGKNYYKISLDKLNFKLEFLDGKLKEDK